MTERIREANIRAVLSRIAKLTGTHDGSPWKREGNRLVAIVGTYLVDSAYGGWKLAQIVNESGGQRDVLYSGYVSRRELYEQMHAYIKGFEDCKYGVRFP